MLAIKGKQLPKALSQQKKRKAWLIIRPILICDIVSQHLSFMTPRQKQLSFFLLTYLV